MARLSQYVSTLSNSLTLALTAKAAEMKKAGIKVCGLVAGEPDFDTPEPIRQAGIKAIHDGFTRYTDSRGIPELRTAIARKIKQKLGIDYGIGDLIIANGGKQAIFSALAATCNPGDEVLIPVPYWLSYPEMASALLAHPKFISTRESDDLKLTPADLEAAITSKSRVLILNSPGNPTGAVYSREELEALVPVLKRHPDLYLLSDEIYDELVYDGKTAPSLLTLAPELRNRIILVNGFSKTYAMTGWRIGYAAGPADVIGAMGCLQSHQTSSINSISQQAALAALEMDEAIVKRMRDEFEWRRNYGRERIKAIPKLSFPYPAGAFYLFINVSPYYGPRLQGSLAFAEELLAREALVIVPGAAFGSDTHIRLSYAVSRETLKEAFDRLERFLKSLK